jgi:hypothetical protein
MEHHDQEVPVVKRRKNSAKIYFFLIALAVLVATNVYYFIEYKSLGHKVELLGSEKYQLEAEVDRIEAELNRLIRDNPTISTILMDNQNEARAQIANLRDRLTAGNVSDQEIAVFRFEVQNLRHLVDEYDTRVVKLKKENQKLSLDRDNLQKSVNSANELVNQLNDENELLQGKIETASSLRISGLTINGVQLRSRERERIESRAKRIDLLRIDFDIVENPLAKKGEHDIYLRIMDPNGNLLTVDNGTFEANEKVLQYTYKTSLDFTNDGKQYSINWEPEGDSNFQKGLYTLVLYSDGHTMGRGSITLK